MKKIIAILFCTIFYSSVFASPHIASKPLYKEELRDDPLFLELIARQTSIYNLVYQSAGYDERKLAEVEKAIRELEGKGLSEDESTKKIGEILGLSGDNSLKDDCIKFRESWTALQQKYGDRLTEDYIREETEAAAGLAPENLRLSPADPCRDTKSYVICAASATATAMLAHAACAITIFGELFCAVIISIKQIKEIRECAHTYCDPIKK